MLVRDLIELLGEFDADAEVHLEHGSGDYWGTTLAPSVASVQMGLVEYSEYHRMDQVAKEDEDEEVAVAPRRVVLIG